MSGFAGFAYQFLPYAGALLCVAIAVFGSLRRHRVSPYALFLAGMILLAAEAVCTGRLVNAVAPDNALAWIRIRFIVTAALAGTWLFFSLIYSRSNYREYLDRWKWVIACAYLAPGIIAIFFNDSMTHDILYAGQASLMVVRLTTYGYVYQLCLLAVTVLILLNFEKTLRSSKGRIRWQIKFMILGMACFWGVRIYTLSQSILYHLIDVSLDLVNEMALLAACVLVAKSLLRSRRQPVGFYVSQTVLFNSFTLLFTGLYLLIVGFIARVAVSIEDGWNLPFIALFVFLSLVLLFSMLLSDRVRKKTKRFISRHFKRPLHDYRKEWEKFTSGTTSILNVKDLCRYVVDMVSSTFDALSVTIWTFDPQRERALCSGSTVYSAAADSAPGEASRRMRDFMIRMEELSPRSDLDYQEDVNPRIHDDYDKDFFEQAKIRYCIPIKDNTKEKSILGIIALDDRVGLDPLTAEDIELLETIASQVAMGLKNIYLSQRLEEAKEMQAFQTMSAFFVHDLKNVASKLSLTMQNLPMHYDNPEFRSDLLRTVSQSVLRISSMTERLKSLSEKIELNLRPIRLDDVVRKCIDDLDASIRERIDLQLNAPAEVSVDAEQLSKVIGNLLLNARDASGDAGRITVSTGQNDSWTLVSIEDEGCGMSKEFIENDLFKPFRTTKRRGLGIGLYHSKAIVEAHHGRLEVESTVGKGSRFTVKI